MNPGTTLSGSGLKLLVSLVVVVLAGAACWPLTSPSFTNAQVDLDCARWLAECEVPFAIAFTKLDSEKKGKDIPLPPRWVTV